MRSCQLQLKLWIVGPIVCLCGLGFFWDTSLALAQETAVETEAVDAPRNGHDCYDLATEEPEPLGEFRQAALETVAIAARSTTSTEAKVNSLTQLSETYACLGQADAATMLAEEAILLTPELESPSAQAHLLIRLASLYGEKLNNLERMNAILSDTTALLTTLPDDSSTQLELASAPYNPLIHSIILLCIRTNSYQKMSEIVNTLEGVLKEQAINSISFRLETAGIEERTQMTEVFPEIDFIRVRFGDVEQTPLQQWLLQIEQLIIELNSAQDAAMMDDLIAAQVSTIESFSDRSAQAYSYVTLSKRLSDSGRAGYAVYLLELAMQKADELDSYELPDGALGYSTYEPNLSSFLAVAFVAADEFERGLELAQDIPDAAERLEVLLRLNRTLTEYSRSSAQNRVALIAAEQTAQSIEGSVSAFVDIAYGYLDIEDFENAERLTEDAITNLQQTERFDVDDYTRSSLIYILIELDSLEHVEELAETIDDSAILVEVITTLVDAGYENMAKRISDNITSPFEQVYAAVNIAETFWALERPAQVYELSVIALEILQDDAFYEDEKLIEIVDYYGENNPTVSEEEIYRTIRESIVLDLLDLLEDDAERRTLFVQLIEDDAFRDSLTLENSVADEDIHLSEEPVSDNDWSRMANEAAEAGDFLQAVEAIVMMESPERQMRSLITITKCHADSTTELDAETNLLLQEIQQRTF
ncbi:MAG: hypothetical protein AAFN40_12285 [Cyanobacteria bacterium J06560_6]